jgi:hypothetical protein
MGNNLSSLTVKRGQPKCSVEAKFPCIFSFQFLKLVNCLTSNKLTHLMNYSKDV